MPQNLLDIWKQIKANHFVGLSVFFTKEGYKCSGCEIVKKRDRIDLKNSFAGVDDLRELPKFVKGKFPVVLIVDGKGIIHKKSVSEVKQQSLISQSVFPGIQLEDFFVQQYKCLNSSFVSIIRHELLNELIKSIKEVGFHVVDCHLGVFIINQFLDQIQYKDNQLDFNYYSVSIQNQSINHVVHKAVKLEGDIKIFQETVVNDSLLPYCAVLDFLLGTNADLVKIDVPDIVKMKDESRHKVLFSRVALFGLLGLVVGLIINFMYFTQLSANLEIIQAQYYANKDLLEELSGLEKLYKDKMKFVEVNHLSKSSENVWYCDRIGVTLLSDMELEELSVHPEVGKAKQNKQIRYNKNHIEIKGYSDSESSFRKWVHNLSSEKWIEDFSIDYFVHNPNEPVEFAVDISIISKE